MVGEGRVFRPDPSVEDTHYHTFPGIALGVSAACRSQTQEGRTAVRLLVAHPILKNHYNAGLRLECLNFSLGQDSRITIEREGIIVHLCARRRTSHCERIVVAVFQEHFILAHLGAVGVDFLSLGRLGCLVAGNIAPVRNDRIMHHDHNV